MRKLLLAGAAMLGGMVGLAAVASAQNAPWNTLDTAAPPTGTLPVARNGSPGAPGTDIPGFGPPLAPGTVTVRFAGRLVVFGGAGADSGQNPGYVLGTRTSPGTLANTKLAPYGIGEYARLFPSVDGVAANGLKYGAFLEVRADQSGAPGGGANGSVGGAQSTRGELYFWRETAYVGTGQTGFLRAGATDQPTSLFETGTFENFDDGGWNANFAFPITSGTQITGPFTDLSALYATNKVVYLSPKFANLVDFGVSFAPDTGSASPGIGACPYANTASGVGCDTTSSTSVAAETKRARNTLDAVVRLRAAAGPVGFAATAGGFASGHVAYDGIEPASQAARYNGYAVFDTGAQRHLWRLRDRRPFQRRPDQHRLVAAAAGRACVRGLVGRRVLPVRRGGGRFPGPQHAGRRRLEQHECGSGGADTEPERRRRGRHAHPGAGAVYVRELPLRHQA